MDKSKTYSMSYSTILASRKERHNQRNWTHRHLEWKFWEFLAESVNAKTAARNALLVWGWLWNHVLLWEE
jgi:hypothetical protein